MKVELKNLKDCPTIGMDGGAWSATLYLDGKRVATVQDDGNGGGNHCRAYGPVAKFCEQNEALDHFYKWCKEQPPIECSYGDGKPIPMYSDYFLSVLFEKTLLEKKLSRWAKTKIVYRLKTDPKGTYQLVPGRKPEWIDQIKAEHGDKLEMIR